jgi:hypothetical protein
MKKGIRTLLTIVIAIVAAIFLFYFYLALTA